MIIGKYLVKAVLCAYRDADRQHDTERLIRDKVMGKKAYLFCRDLDACKRAAMMYSLFGACKVLDENPERWLCYVLKHIDSTPEDKYYTLLPEFWEDEEQ